MWDSKVCSLCRMDAKAQGGTLGAMLGPLIISSGESCFVHRMCALWSPEVYQSNEGTLKKVPAAVRRGRQIKCWYCGRRGATVGCRLERCQCSYHLPCARLARCAFNAIKYVIACPEHAHLFRHEQAEMLAAAPPQQAGPSTSSWDQLLQSPHQKRSQLQFAGQQPAPTAAAPAGAAAAAAPAAPTEEEGEEEAAVQAQGPARKRRCIDHAAIGNRIALAQSVMAALQQQGPPAEGWPAGGWGGPQQVDEDEDAFVAKEQRRLERDRARLQPVVLTGRGAVSAGAGAVALHQWPACAPGFESLGGLPDVVQSLKEMVLLPLMYPHLLQHLGVVPPRGILLYGAPGTGKTHTVRALAGECAKHSPQPVTLFARKAADCLGKFSGDAERTLRLLFDEAQRRAPSIIFLDELDALVPARSVRGGTSDQIYASVVSTLLSLMDGVADRGNVIVIAATNRPEAIDPALRRPGRFDREVYFGLPSAAARLDILRVHTRHWQPQPPSSRLLQHVARATEGFAGADLQALCSCAVLAAVRRSQPSLLQNLDAQFSAVEGQAGVGAAEPQLLAPGPSAGLPLSAGAAQPADAGRQPTPGSGGTRYGTLLDMFSTPMQGTAAQEATDASHDHHDTISSAPSPPAPATAAAAVATAAAVAAAAGTSGHAAASRPVATSFLSAYKGFTSIFEGAVGRRAAAGSLQQPPTSAPAMLQHTPAAPAMPAIASNQQQGDQQQQEHGGATSVPGGGIAPSGETCTTPTAATPYSAPEARGVHMPMSPGVPPKPSSSASQEPATACLQDSGATALPAWLSSLQVKACDWQQALLSAPLPCSKREPLALLEQQIEQPPAAHILPLLLPVLLAALKVLAGACLPTPARLQRVLQGLRSAPPADEQGSIMPAAVAQQQVDVSSSDSAGGGDAVTLHHLSHTHGQGSQFITAQPAEPSFQQQQQQQQQEEEAKVPDGETVYLRLLKLLAHEGAAASSAAQPAATSTAAADDHVSSALASYLPCKILLSNVDHEEGAAAASVLLKLLEGAKVCTLSLPGLIQHGQGDPIDGCLSVVNEARSRAPRCMPLVLYLPQFETWSFTTTPGAPPTAPAPSRPPAPAGPAPVPQGLNPALSSPAATAIRAADVAVDELGRLAMELTYETASPHSNVIGHQAHMLRPMLSFCKASRSRAAAATSEAAKGTEAGQMPGTHTNLGLPGHAAESATPRCRYSAAESMFPEHLVQQQQQQQEEGLLADPEATCTTSPVWAVFEQALKQVPPDQPVIVLATCQLPPETLPEPICTFFEGGVNFQHAAIIVSNAAAAMYPIESRLLCVEPPGQELWTVAVREATAYIMQQLQPWLAKGLADVLSDREQQQQQQGAQDAAACVTGMPAAVLHAAAKRSAASVAAGTPSAPEAAVVHPAVHQMLADEGPGSSPARQAVADHTAVARAAVSAVPTAGYSMQELNLADQRAAYKLLAQVQAAISGMAAAMLQDKTCMLARGRPEGTFGQEGGQPPEVVSLSSIAQKALAGRFSTLHEFGAAVASTAAAVRAAYATRTMYSRRAAAASLWQDTIAAWCFTAAQSLRLHDACNMHLLMAALSKQQQQQQQQQVPQAPPAPSAAPAPYLPAAALPASPPANTTPPRQPAASTLPAPAPPAPADVAAEQVNEQAHGLQPQVCSELPGLVSALKDRVAAHLQAQVVQQPAPSIQAWSNTVGRLLRSLVSWAVTALPSTPLPSPCPDIGRYLAANAMEHVSIGLSKAQQ